MFTSRTARPIPRASSRDRRDIIWWRLVARNAAVVATQRVRVRASAHGWSEEAGQSRAISANCAGNARSWHPAARARGDRVRDQAGMFQTLASYLSMHAGPTRTDSGGHSSVPANAGSASERHARTGGTLPPTWSGNSGATPRGATPAGVARSASSGLLRRGQDHREPLEPTPARVPG